MPLNTAQPFATVEEYEARTIGSFTDAQRVQLAALLLDATAHLRSLIGQHVTAGSTTAVLHLALESQWLDLPQLPVRSVTSVEVGPVGAQVPVPFELVDQALYLPAHWWAQDETVDLGLIRSGYRRVVVTFDFGLTEVPGELRSWAIVLASQALAHLSQGGAFGSAGLQSERIDDYAVNYATTGEGAVAFHIPAMAAEQLRARYGAGAYVTGTR